jgi:L,D-peptidoglycan transpeptidase YkuD (ErfK/YbiS/YcfS/YnhG family)
MDIDGIPSGTGYDNIGDTIVNGDTDKCMYIEHNGDGYSTENVVSGKGSAITICGKTSGIHATAGCVDIASSDFNAMLTMLDYSKNPHIEIVS